MGQPAAEETSIMKYHESFPCASEHVIVAELLAGKKLFKRAETSGTLDLFRLTFD